MSPRGDLGRKSIVLFTGTWLANGLGLLLTVLIARVLGPEALGILGFSTGLVGLLTAFLLPGFAQAHQKRVAEGADLGRCVGTMGALQLAIQLSALLLLLLASRWGSLVIPAGVPISVVLFVLAAQLLVNLSTSLSVAFVGREWAMAHAATQLSGSALRFAATVAVLAWAPDIRWVAAAMLVEGATEILVGAYILAVRRGVIIRRPNRATIRSYWSYARPFLVINPIGIAQDSLDRIFVAHWAGLTVAGYYQVARTLWEILGTINAYPFQLLLSRLSRLFATGGARAAAETRTVFAAAVDRLLFLAVPAAFALWALRQPVVSLVYGERFLPAVEPLMIFVLAALAQAAFNPYHFILYAMDQQWRYTGVVLLRFVVYLLAMVALVPLWGGVGAAAVRFLLVIFPCWVFVRWTRELAGIGFQWVTAAYLSGFALLVLVDEAVRRTLSSAGVSMPVAIAGGIVVALGAYAAFLWLTHTGTGGNLRYARELIDPRRFWSFLARGDSSEAP